ncbi:MAG: LysM peptidoglycan-binding domain-containing protein [Saprospirales bacterium]|nr:MAG: LysM peptidoglycan-binding domain-containing protein [Saprospirales bacterium]
MSFHLFFTLLTLKKSFSFAIVNELICFMSCFYLIKKKFKMFLREKQCLGTIFAIVKEKAVIMKINRIPLFLTIFFLAPFILMASDGRQAIYNYIEQYKDIAIFEMERTGIPASIKMAQAILESNAGRSELALRANNHFGIKCGGNWSGGTHYRKDDDRDSRGRLIESCFRAYSSAEESFIAHSDFLAGEDRRTRYGWLFDLDPYDYKAWAHGLQKSGYATNRRYGQLLINVINNYSLYELDKALDDPDFIVSRPNTPQQNTSAAANAGQQRENIFNNSGFSQGPRREFEINQLRVVKASAGENIADLALELEIPVRALLRFNEGIDDAFEPFPADRNVFLQPMRRAYRDGRNQHRIREGETMQDLAIAYGVRINQLYRRNRMDEGREPAVGQNIYLRGRRSRGDVVRYRAVNTNRQPQSPAIEEVIPEPEVDTKTSEELIVHATSDTAGDMANTRPDSTTDAGEAVQDKLYASQHEEQINGSITHTVSAGETLFAISRMYGKSVDEIIAANNLESNVLSIGQVLVIR